MAKPRCGPEPLAGPEPPLGPELSLVAGGETPGEPAALVVVVIPRWATEALFGLLPQAATSRAPLASTTLIKEARRPSRTDGLECSFMSLVITRVQ
jgi:hypothetical protein